LPRLLGRSGVAELLGAPLGTALGVEDHETARYFCTETLRRGHFACDLEAKVARHGDLWVEASGMLSATSGRTCVMAILRDVSSRKAVEDELRRSCEALSAELESARDAKHATPLFLAK